LIINIIHLTERRDRWTLLHQELQTQCAQYRVWNGVRNAENNTTRAISKAHKQIVKHAWEHHWPEVMIAEDDLEFTASGALDFFLSNKPANFDLYLGSIYHGRIKEDHTVNDFAGLTLYIIHKKFYESFLNVNESEDIDRALKDKGKFVVCEPFVAIQRNGYSDHSGRFCDYKLYLKGRVLFNKSSLAQL